MRKALLLSFSALIYLQANTTLELYTNKAFLMKSFLSPKEIEIKTPLHIELDDILYTLEDGCKIENDYFKKEIISESNFKEQIKVLKSKKEDLEAKLSAQVAKKNLFSTLSLENIKEFSKIEKTVSFLEKNVLTLTKEINKTKEELESVSQELMKLEEKPKIEYKTLHVSFTCKKDSSAFISYPFESLEFKSSYDFTLDSQKQEITIKDKIAITQNSFEDLNEIELKIYSKAFSKEMIPQTFYPHYLYKNRAKPIAYDGVMAKAMNMEAMAPTQKRMIIKRENLETLYSYSLSNVTLKRGAMQNIELSQESIPTKLNYYADAYGSNKAYLQTKFTPKKSYVSREAKLYLDSLPLGVQRSTHLKEGIEATLFFGANQFIDVKKELVKTEDESGFFSGKSSIQKWKYTLKNRSNKVVQLEFVTKTPVSKDGDIEVKAIAEPQFDSLSAEGKTTWNLTLKPKEAREIVFGYEIKRSE